MTEPTPEQQQNTVVIQLEASGVVGQGTAPDPEEETS